MMLFFKTHGYEVSEAQRGEEAFKLIRDVDNFDVVITDLRMPGMIDGLEVLFHAGTGSLSARNGFIQQLGRAA